MHKTTLLDESCQTYTWIYDNFIKVHILIQSIYGKVYLVFTLNDKMDALDMANEEYLQKLTFNNIIFILILRSPISDLPIRRLERHVKVIHKMRLENFFLIAL